MPSLGRFGAADSACMHPPTLNRSETNEVTHETRMYLLVSCGVSSSVQSSWLVSLIDDARHVIEVPMCTDQTGSSMEMVGGLGGWDHVAIPRHRFGGRAGSSSMCCGLCEAYMVALLW